MNSKEEIKILLRTVLVMIDQEIHWPITRTQNLIADQNLVEAIIEINADLPGIQRLHKNKASIKAINQQLHDLGMKYWGKEYRSFLIQRNGLALLVVYLLELVD